MRYSYFEDHLFQAIFLLNANIFKSNPYSLSCMCAHHDKETEDGGGYRNLTVVAWSILVMGISLAAVIVLWVLIGYIGPTFSSDTLAKQQESLRTQYHLPFRPVITDPKVLQTPPSLRNSTGSSNSSSQ
jgi:hypothetical protein